MYQSPRYGGRRQSIPPKRIVRKIKRTAAVIMMSSLVIGGGLIFFFDQHHKAPADGKHSHQANHAAGPTNHAPTTDGFDKNKYSTSENSSLWVVVNKKHPLNPKDYTPESLVVPNIPLRSNITNTEKYIRADTAKALEHMVKEASSQGIHLNLQSGYRSYSFQVNLYNGYVKQQGQAAADRQSARPGYSEHQTGLAADMGGTSQPSCNVASCFATTTEGKWLATNAYRYGFLIRYTVDGESTTGYEYEPWHIRYIGTNLSTEMHTQGVETLEAFFDIPGGTAY